MKLSPIVTLMIRPLITSGVIVLMLVAWTLVMAKWGYGSPPPQFPADEQADLIVVHKAQRRLLLMHQKHIIARYSISLGPGAGDGAKEREGDKKTPEGRYVIDSRNTHSRFYLSLHISYPNGDDLQGSQRDGYPPGGNIMIHGLPNGWGWFSALFRLLDWTNGCIAVSNTAMQEIWARVPTGTLIEITP